MQEMETTTKIAVRFNGHTTFYRATTEKQERAQKHKKEKRFYRRPCYQQLRVNNLTMVQKISFVDFKEEKHKHVTTSKGGVKRFNHHVVFLCENQK